MNSKDWISGFVILLIGLVAHIVGVASPYWVIVDGVDFGLWLICGEIGCVSFLMYEESLSVWFHVVQGISLAGSLATILAFFITVVYLKTQSLTVVLAPGLLAFFGGMFIGTSVLVYAVKEWSYSVVIGWAFYVECTASALILVSSVVLFIAACRTKLKSVVISLGRTNSVIPGSPQMTTEL